MTVTKVFEIIIKKKKTKPINLKINAKRNKMKIK